MYNCCNRHCMTYLDVVGSDFSYHGLFQAVSSLVRRARQNHSWRGETTEGQGCTAVVFVGFCHGLGWQGLDVDRDGIPRNRDSTGRDSAGRDSTVGIPRVGIPRVGIPRSRHSAEAEFRQVGLLSLLKLESGESDSGESETGEI